MKQKDRREQWRQLGLICLFMFENVLHLAVQREAQRVNGFCADVLALLHAVERVCGKALMINQVVDRDVFLPECFKKGFTVKDGVADKYSVRLPRLAAPIGYVHYGWEDAAGNRYVEFSYTLDQAGRTFEFVPIFGKETPQEEVVIDVGSQAAFAELMFRIQAFFEQIANAFARFFSFAWLFGKI